MQSHQIRDKTTTIIDNIEADPGNVSLVINYTLSTSKIDSRHRSVVENKRRRKTVDLLRIVNQNMDLDEMARHIIASERLLKSSHFNIVKTAIRGAKKFLLRQSVGLSDHPNPQLSQVARQRYQKEVSCMGTSCYLICGARRVRPCAPPGARPRAQTPAALQRSWPTNARRQYMEDVYGHGIGTMLAHPDTTKPSPAKRRPGEYPATAFVDKYNDQRLSFDSVHRKVLTWPQSLPVSKTKSWFPS